MRHNQDEASPSNLLRPKSNRIGLVISYAALCIGILLAARGIYEKNEGIRSISNYKGYSGYREWYQTFAMGCILICASYLYYPNTKK
jgi:hypothetical protein